MKFTREEILGMDPGQLDLAVAVNIYGLKYAKDDVLYIPNYSKDIEPAWVVFQALGKMLFSTRRKFMDELQEIVSKENPPVGVPEWEGWRIEWPDVFRFVTPEYICKAALLTMLEV